MKRSGTQSLTDAEQLKFHLLASGVTISNPAREYLRTRNGDRPFTPADFASTTGVILKLEGNVWVNAPIADYNPNFVSDSPFVLDVTEDALVVHGLGLASAAQFWLPPDYHGELGANGAALNESVFTHGDRVRLSPIRGCAMTCKFCNVPYEDRYATKQVETMVQALECALNDPSQPAHHVLISGGTPRDEDVGLLQDVYRTVLATFPDVDIDIMMAPVAGLLDLPALAHLGLCEISINIELFDDDAAKRLMPSKHRQGRSHYLDMIAEASSVLGPGRARSMLMVGLEPMESTLQGVTAIAERGGVPVLSPFRPDPSTPLRQAPPPNAAVLEETFLRSDDLARAAGISLGPNCLPCMHNTLTLPANGDDTAYRYQIPNLV